MAFVKDKARPQSIVDRQITATGDSFKRQGEITPSDSAVFNPRLQGFVVGAAGTVEAINSNGDQVTYTCVAGQTVIAEIAQILATGTTATGIVGLS